MRDAINTLSNLSALPSLITVAKVKQMHYVRIIGTNNTLLAYSNQTLWFGFCSRLVDAT